MINLRNNKRRPFIFVFYPFIDIYLRQAKPFLLNCESYQSKTAAIESTDESVKWNLLKKSIMNKEEEMWEKMWVVLQADKMKPPSQRELKWVSSWWSWRRSYKPLYWTLSFQKFFVLVRSINIFVAKSSVLCQSDAIERFVTTAIVIIIKYLIRRCKIATPPLLRLKMFSSRCRDTQEYWFLFMTKMSFVPLLREVGFFLTTT